jgi:hypothetical protein
VAYVPRIPARVDDQGQLRPADPVAWRSYLNRNKGRDVWVTVKRQTKMHTDRARSYYHGVVVEYIANEIGESHDETHAMLKQRSPVLKARRIETLSGKELEMPPRTRDLPSDVYAAYVDETMRWAATFLGLYIPTPNEVEVSL